jgi:hypothetical protein
LEETHQTLRKNILEAQANQTKYTGCNEVVGDKVGDKVGLSTWHYRTTRPSKKLHFTLAGPYRVI